MSTTTRGIQGWPGWEAGKTLPDGRPRCKWCAGPVEKPRRTWCSNKCVREYQVRNSASSARFYVFQRDRGVCAECGTDTEDVRRRLELWHAENLEHYRSHRYDEWKAGSEKLNQYADELIQKGFDGVGVRPYGCRVVHRSLWDADHITPVVEGGGGINGGLDNLRTLCQPCHKTETAKLAKRRAMRRRTQPELPLEQDPALPKGAAEVDPSNPADQDGGR